MRLVVRAESEAEYPLRRAEQPRVDSDGGPAGPVAGRIPEVPGVRIVVGDVRLALGVDGQRRIEPCIPGSNDLSCPGAVVIGIEDQAHTRQIAVRDPRTVRERVDRERRDRVWCGARLDRGPSGPVVGGEIQAGARGVRDFRMSRRVESDRAE